MKSIRVRNFMLTAMLVIFSFVVMGISFGSISYRHIIQERRETISVTAYTIANTAEATVSSSDLYDWNLRITITTIADATESNIVLFNEAGMAVSCSDEDIFCQHIGKYLPNSIVTSVESDGIYTAVTDLNGFYPEQYYVALVPISYPDTGTRAGYAMVSVDLESMVQIWSSFVSIFLFVALTVLVIAMVMSIITSNRQTAPIKAVADAARKFAHGDFSARVETSETSVEISELVSAFNMMADSLEKSEQRRSEFIANVSHELKTPMTSIAGFADGILDGTIPPEKEKEYLAVISDETRRLSRLVRNMLDMSRVQATDPIEIRKESFDVSEVLRQTLLSLEEKINARKLDVDARLPEEPIVVQGRKDDITRVVYNLLDNAIKFADPETVLTLSLWKQGEKAYVSVKDQGKTIPPEELSLIFDRFHKADKSRSVDKDGVGLGLYIVKTILNSHGENIKVTSKDGITEFCFTLTLRQTKKTQ